MSCTQKQQLVCFPKVRVYKPWFRHFNDHKDFRNEGTVHLFSLMALFSYFDIVWSGKVGYIYISIDSCRGTVGDMDCLVIDSPEELLDKLLYEMAVDIMEEVGHTIDPTEATLLERREIERRIHPYLEQLPAYQDRLQRVFTREK